MTTTYATSTDLIEAARALAPQIEAYRDQGERERTMPKELVRAIAEAGLFRIWIPKALGGFEADIETNLRVIEEISRADGAAGWNVMIGGTGGMFAAFLPESAAREIFGDPLAIGAGALAPKGRAGPLCPTTSRTNRRGSVCCAMGAGGPLFELEDPLDFLDREW